MAPIDPQGEGEKPLTAEQKVQAAFAALAFGSLLTGAVVYFLRGVLGIPDDTARLVGTAFVLAAIADALVLFLWDRIFKRPQ